jgi:hypothetical protein
MKWIIAPEWGIGPACARSIVAVAIADRFAACKLVLHPEKTKILYRKGVNRGATFRTSALTFLGSSLELENHVGEAGQTHLLARLPA